MKTILFSIICIISFIFCSCDFKTNRIDLSEIDIKNKFDDISNDSSIFDPDLSDTSEFVKEIKIITKSILRLDQLSYLQNNHDHLQIVNFDNYFFVNYNSFHLKYMHINENYWADKFCIFRINTFYKNDSVFVFAVSKKLSAYFLDGFCKNDINKLIRHEIGDISSVEKAYKIGRFFVQYCSNFIFPVVLIDSTNIKKYRELNNKIPYEKIKLPELYDYGDHYKLIIYSVIDYKYHISFKNIIIMNDKEITSFKTERLYDDLQIRLIDSMLKANPDRRKEILRRAR